MNGERLLAAGVLLLALAAAWAQGRSALGARLRDGLPWTAWIEAREAAPAVPTFHVAVYWPSARRLYVVHAPGDAKVEGRLTLDRAYLEALRRADDRDAAAREAEDLAGKRLAELAGQALPSDAVRLRVAMPRLAPEDEPSAEAASALRSRFQRPAGWLGLPGFEALLFGLEVRGVPPERVHAVRLPDEKQAPDLLRRLLAAPREPRGGATTAEVLNATAAPGLASQARKMLRSEGFDVVALGSVPARRRTMVYDRTGELRAAEVLRALGCPEARVVSRVDASRVVDVTVELGQDCVDKESEWN